MRKTNRACSRTSFSTAWMAAASFAVASVLRDCDAGDSASIVPFKITCPVMYQLSMYKTGGGEQGVNIFFELHFAFYSLIMRIHGADETATRSLRLYFHLRDQERILALVRRDWRRDGAELAGDGA